VDAHKYVFVHATLRILSLFFPLPWSTISARTKPPAKSLIQGINPPEFNTRALLRFRAPSLAKLGQRWRESLQRPPRPRELPGHCPLCLWTIYPWYADLFRILWTFMNMFLVSFLLRGPDHLTSMEHGSSAMEWGYTCCRVLIQEQCPRNRRSIPWIITCPFSVRACRW